MKIHVYNHKPKYNDNGLFYGYDLIDEGYIDVPRFILSKKHTIVDLNCYDKKNEELIYDKWFKRYVTRWLTNRNSLNANTWSIKCRFEDIEYQEETVQEIMLKLWDENNFEYMVHLNSEEDRIKKYPHHYGLKMLVGFIREIYLKKDDPNRKTYTPKDYIYPDELWYRKDENNLVCIWRENKNDN